VGLSNTSIDAPKIIEGKQDYVRSLQMILKYYSYPITISTIETWCEVIKSKRYRWDSVNFKDILELLRPHMEKAIPLTHDFGQFNEDVFGFEWSDRKCIIEQYLHLQSQYECLRDQYNTLLDMFNKRVIEEDY